MFQFGDFSDMEMQKGARSLKLPLLPLNTPCPLNEAIALMFISIPTNAHRSYVTGMTHHVTELNTHLQFQSV